MDGSNCYYDSVHPRLRGEHLFLGRQAGVVAGSSPPTRGTLNSGHYGIDVARFIPAYAGNTTLSGHKDITAPVHPRLRGEH